MSEQQSRSLVRIFGIATRRSTRMRIQGTVFLVLGLGSSGSTLLRNGPLAKLGVARVALGVSFVVFGLLLLFGRAVDSVDT